MDYVDRFVDNISHMTKREKIVKLCHMVAYSNKEYFNMNRVYEKFQKILDKKTIDKTLASCGASHFVHPWDVVEKHFNALNKTDAGKAVLKMPYSFLDRLVPLRDDNSIKLRHRDIKDVILSDERNFLIKFSEKIIPTTYYGYHVELWREVGIDAMICEALINRGHPPYGLMKAMVQNLHSWVWNNSPQKIFDLFSAMQLQNVPVEYYLKRGDVVPIDNPSEVFSRLKNGSYLTENILRIFLENFPKDIRMEDVIQEGSIELAIEYYDPESNFDWSPYTTQLVNMIDESPGVLQILKTISTDRLLSNARNISKMPWIKPKDMENYFKNLESSSEEAQCAICLDVVSHIDAQIKTACNHTYHYRCFDKIIDKSSCPMCRQKMF